MRYLLSFIIGVILTFILATTANAAELLTAPWHVQISGGHDVNLYQSVSPNVLNGMSSLTLTYNLNGHCLRSGGDSSIIFDQNGWKRIYLANYGTNCLNGNQTVTIPLSDFTGLNTTQNLTGSFHSRFWHNLPVVFDITSAVLNPAVTPSWPIQAVDTMKDSKDKVCNQLSDATITSRIAKAKALGVTHVAIATPYQNPGCGDSLAYTGRWITAIRAQGLKVWHRHPNLKFEGIYSTTKVVDPDGARHVKDITDWLLAHPNWIQSGDIFTPEAEPQNGGIAGVTYCPQNICQFSSKEDFNRWLRQTTLATKLALQAIDKTDVKVGYWGFDGFVTWGNDNPDHQGTSKLEAKTVEYMDNIIAIDHYNSQEPMATDLDQARAVWPNADFFIGEWGTISETTDTARAAAVDTAFNAFKARSWIKGVNYWQLGPDGINEPLINADNTNRPSFDRVKFFFTGQ